MSKPKSSNSEGLARLRQSERLRRVADAVASLEGQRALLSSQMEAATAAAADAQTQVAAHEKALSYLQELEQTWRGRFEGALAAVVGQGLSAVFEDNIKVLITTTTKRGIASLEIRLVTDGLETPVLGAKGGSVVNVLAALLRVLLVVSHRPPMRRLLILDEPFTHVSAEFRPALCALLREMAHRLDMQFLIVSHEPDLEDAADAVYAVARDGRGTVRCIKAAEEERQ